MKRTNLAIALLICLLVLVAAALLHPSTAQALPEYSAQTGEPCATCHLSPSGGGPRGPRGQAWVGSGKPSTVPALVEALELLGVELQVNESDYQASDQPAPPEESLQMDCAPKSPLHEWLKNYDGN